MGRIETLILSEDDIEQVSMSMAECIEVVEETVRQEGLGNALIASSPPLLLGKRQPKLYLHGMPAYVGGVEAAGLKWVSHTTGNEKLGLPSGSALIILNDTRTGMPYCILEAMWVSYVRTAAVTAVAAKYLARPGSETLGVVGAGRLDRDCIAALRETLPGLKRVKAVARREASRQAFCDEMSKVVAWEFSAVGAVREAMEDADILISSPTQFDEPPIRYEWVKQGALVAPLVGGAEVDVATLSSADKLLVQHWPTFCARMTTRSLDAATLTLHAELGEVVCGKKPGRERDDETIVSINGSVGTSDMAIGKRLYEAALKKGIGTTLSLF